jgi:hypothetical protein
MSSTGQVGLAGLLQPFHGVLADRLEHRKALRVPADEALVEQGSERVELGLADSLGRVQREAAGEHTEPSEELLLSARAELVAPLDRRAQRALPLGQVAP